MNESGTNGKAHHTVYCIQYNTLSKLTEAVVRRRSVKNVFLEIS